MTAKNHSAVGLLMLLAVFAMMFGACVVAPVVPPLGAVYSNVNAPIDLSSGQGKQIGPDKGKASTVDIFYLFAFGDASINAAARNGNLKTVNHVDYEFKNVLFGIYSRYTTVVYGEKK